jgi:hypothetical protein
LTLFFFALLSGLAYLAPEFLAKAGSLSTLYLVVFTPFHTQNHSVLLPELR